VVAVLALASRVGLLLLGELWLALPFTAQLPLGQYVAPGSGQLDRLGLSDPVLYRTIMESGYERRPFSDDRQANWAFLPAWPVLWRAAAAVLPADTAAVLLNVVLFSVGCVLVFVLLRHYLGEAAALLAAALLIVAPGAQFTVRPGPESLFLVASAGALLLAQRGRWWLVAPVVTLAALTRPQGWLLGVPLALIALQQLRQRWSPQQLLAMGVALLAPVVAVALFCAYLGRLTGNPSRRSTSSAHGTTRRRCRDWRSCGARGRSWSTISSPTTTPSTDPAQPGRDRCQPAAARARDPSSNRATGPARLHGRQPAAAASPGARRRPRCATCSCCSPSTASPRPHWRAGGLLRRALLLTLLVAQVAMYLAALHGVEWALT
jgi:hypothetical protein